MDIDDDGDDADVSNDSFRPPSKTGDGKLGEGSEVGDAEPDTSSEAHSLVGEDETIHGKMSGWKSFKSFYGYGLSRSKDLADVVGGHHISSSSRHVSA